MIVPSTDSRNVWQRLSRRQLWRLLEHHKIDHRDNLTADAAIVLLQASGANPMEGIEWINVGVKNESGNVRQEAYPVEKERGELEYDFEAELEKRTQVQDENTDLKGEIAELKAQLSKLMEMVADKQESTPVDVAPEDQEKTKTETQNLENLKFHELKSLAKQKGLTLPITTKKPAMIEAIRAKDAA